MMADWPLINETDIQRWLGDIYSERGKAYYRQDHVLDLDMDDGLLSATVNGGVAGPYQLNIRINSKDALLSSC